MKRIILALIALICSVAYAEQIEQVQGQYFTCEIPCGWTYSIVDSGWSASNDEYNATIVFSESSTPGISEVTSLDWDNILLTAIGDNSLDMQFSDVLCKAGRGRLGWYSEDRSGETVCTLYFATHHKDSALVAGCEWVGDQSFKDEILSIYRSIDLVRNVAAQEVSTQPEAAAGTESMDFSGMSLAELIEVRSQIQQAMWETDEWQSVEVPEGVYEIGVDIPAGYWTITLAGSTCMEWGTELDEYGANVVYGSIIDSVDKWEEPKSVSWNMAESTYLYISGKPVIFTPYAGKPDLGFK